MADTILGGDITVSYLDDNRQKMIEWTGNDSDTHTLNAVYSALMDLFDASAQSDDGTPMSAQTPTEYTVGLIDSGDTDDPWYISYECMEHITGGALRTASWARVTTSNCGIVVVPVTSNSMTKATDVGATMTNGSDTGTLLEVIDDGTSQWLVIRPTNNTATHDWDTGSGTISSSASANTATQSAVATTGEQIWANFFSLGTIEPDTHIYGYYGDNKEPDDETGRARITAVNSTTEDWWGDGAIDVCIPIRDWTTAANPIIDDGFAIFKANKYSTEYSFFEVEASTTSGGRNPVPLSTKDDLNNDTGFRQVTLGTSAGTWLEGDEILGATSGARGIITGTSGSNPTITLYYYLLSQEPTTTDQFGGALTDFNGSEAINNQGPGTGTSASSGATSAYGPAQSTWFTNNTAPTITYGNYQADIDNDSNNEQYGILIDCNQNPLTEVYEWLKYQNRFGQTTSSGTGAGGTDVAGELWRGGSVYIYYGTSAVSGGTIAEGDDVLQETTGATGVVVSHDTTSNIMLLRDVRGTFATGTATDHTITSQDAGAGSVEMETADNAEAVAFAENPVSPYGTFAGGTFFGARGVALTDWVAADENSFQLTPIEGGTKSRPQAFSITVTNLNGTAISDNTADLVAVLELSSDGGPVNKTQYSSTGGTTAGATTQVVDTAITADTPSSGTIVIRDNSDNNNNYYIRYASWATSTFTLDNTSSGTCNDTGSTTTATNLNDSTATFITDGVQRGDIVYSSTNTASAYVESVDSETVLTLADGGITGLSNTDAYAINVMPIDDDTLDDVYVVPLHTYPTTTSASVSIQYVDTYYYRAIVRNNRATTKIVPFTATGSVTSGTDNQTVQTVRNEDTITT